MAALHLPRSLVALFPDAPRRLEVSAADLAGLIMALDARYPGMWERLCEPGPRLRAHINAFVDGRPAVLGTPLDEGSVVHIIPAVSGGAGRSGRGELRPEPERVHAETREAWRTWLETHHARPDGVWLVSWKAHTGRPRMSYEEAVEEALCFGWVDSRSGTLDDERSMLWMSRRRKGSAWSRSNKERVERLEREGRMTDAGRGAMEAARGDGSWTLLDAVEDLSVPHDLAAALDAHPGAREHWDAFPRSVRRSILEWMVQARRPATRRRRVTETAELAQRGERANQWTPKRP